MSWYTKWWIRKEIIRYVKNRKQEKIEREVVRQRFDDYMGERSVYDKWLNEVQPRIVKANETHKNYGKLRERTLEELISLRDEYDSILVEMNNIEKIQVPKLTTFEIDKRDINKKLIIINCVINNYKN